MNDDRRASSIDAAAAGDGGGVDANAVPAAPAAAGAMVAASAPAIASSSGTVKEVKADAPAAATPDGGEQRMRFYVELKPGETTIVSWKKLLKEHGKDGGVEPSATAAVDPPFVAQAGTDGVPVGMPENEPKDATPPPSRFSAVIEKIERLYMGKQSSDEEELDDIPDDDQYDTEDSFIDDTELDEYFQVDKLTTKHDGYFVNKGKLEQVEPNSSSPKEAPKKRRRKDSTKFDVLDLASNDGVFLSNMQIKDPTRAVPLEGRSLPYNDDVVASHGELYYQGKSLKQKATSSAATIKKKSSDNPIGSENPVIPGAISNIVLSLPSERTNFDKHKSSKAIAHKVKGASGSSDPLHQTPHLKDQVEFQSKKLMNGEKKVASKIRPKEKSGTGNSPALDPYVAYSVQSGQSSAKVKEGSSVRPKGTTLERAFRDLEKIVAECRPPAADVQDADPALQGVKRRLPQEVKQKLAKVARLSANQGKISEDIISRLMTILGHLLQRKTLKRHLKEMVELGLSAKQQKADRFQHIKREVYDMIRTRVSQLKAKVTEKQDGSIDDFQEVIPNDDKRAVKGKVSMDAAMEDKICDLYDLYIEGMDEDKGPHCRKLYVELAELWPSGYMDNVGIKDAINRSKERKRALLGHRKVHEEERIKRKKLASASRVDETIPGARIRPVEDRPVADSTNQALASSTKLASSQSAASVGRLVESSPSYTDLVHPGVKKSVKSRESDATKVSDIVSKPHPDAKKMKRKPELELVGVHSHPQKVLPHEITEKQKALKHSDDTAVNHQTRQASELPGFAASDQTN